MSRQINSLGLVNQLTASANTRKDWFQDPEFQPCSKSLSGDGTFDKSIVWMRPFDIVQNPKFIVEGASRQDLDQGNLGDCWFIAAAAALASNYSDMFKRIILPNEEFDTKDYCGQFRFKFWWFGAWTEVVIDDYLPCQNKKPCYCCCSEATNEFWPSLLEKAYAKLNGTYESLNGGHTHDGMVDLTGGIPQAIYISEKENIDKKLFKCLKRAFDMKTLMGASINPQERNEENRDDGLVTGHAYSITRFYEKISSSSQNTGLRLVRLRNPWGNTKEWNGAWSDKSKQIMEASEQMKKDLHIHLGDGEFWMSFEDFVSRFDWIQLCHTDPNAWISNQNEKFTTQEWKEIVVRSSWVKGATAGGSAGVEFFWNNPTFNIRFESDSNWVIISLMHKKTDKTSDAVIGFEIYEAKTKERKYRLNQSNTRDITRRLHLNRGKYVIVPFTSDDTTRSTDFIMRIFASVLPKISAPVTCMPPQKVDMFQQLYEKYASNNEQMDANDLQGFLTEIFSDHKIEVNIEMARTLLAMLDTDKSRCLSSDEMKRGHNLIKKCMKIYDFFDKDGMQAVNTHLLTEMLGRLEITVSHDVLIAIVERYSQKECTLTLEDFILAVFRLTSLYEHLKENDSASFEKTLAIAMRH